MDNKVKKKRNNSNKVIIILTSLFITSTIGSLTGTYAWFEYSARAKLQYHGTAISESKILEVGLYSPIELKNAEKYNLYLDPNNEGIYWAGSELTSDAVRYFCITNGCSSNTLSATTSGKFNEGDDFLLKRAPQYLSEYNDNDSAFKFDYVHLPLRFRARQGLSLGDGNTAVVLNDLKMNFEGDAKSAARIHFGSSTANFILNPNSKENGSTIVGGPLDLDGDGFYDYASIGKGEFLYGQVDGEIEYLSDLSTNETPMDEEKRSCFNSAHAYGVYGIDADSTVFSEAEYYGLQDTKLVKELTRMSSQNKIASLDVDIYIEGWSRETIEQNANDRFSLDLTFEVQEI